MLKTKKNIKESSAGSSLPPIKRECSKHKVWHLVRSLERELAQLGYALPQDGSEICLKIKKAFKNQNGASRKSGAKQVNHQPGTSLKVVPSSKLKPVLDANVPLCSIFDKRNKAFVQLPMETQIKIFKACKHGKICSIRGRFTALRRALSERGWFDKFRLQQKLGLNTPFPRLTGGAVMRQTQALKRMIEKLPVSFTWNAQNQASVTAATYVNRIARGQRGSFTTKYGIKNCVAKQPQYIRHPSTYLLDSLKERDAFIENYRATQTRCLVRYISAMLKQDEEKQSSTLCDVHHGTISGAIIQFAIKSLKRQLGLEEPLTVSTKGQMGYHDFRWQDFIDKSLAVMRKKAKFRLKYASLKKHVELAQTYLEKLEKLQPKLKWEGVRNLWITKPSAGTCGHGICIHANYRTVLQRATSHRHSIVQKYVECPLLIYNTKFDVRQYFMLTIDASRNISVWLYQDCYLKFCSQPFTLEDLRPSVHISNNHVQRHYRNSFRRDARLPACNMWSLSDFKAYIEESGLNPNLWSKVTYKLFRRNIIGLVLASYHEFTRRPNTFEVFGCDFMLDQLYEPILLEVNSSPDLSPTTPVTRRICPNMLRDVLKVVLDLPKEANASTGLFEKIYEIPYKNQ